MGLTIYWISVLSAVSNTLPWMMILSVVTLLACFVLYCGERSDIPLPEVKENTTLNKICKVSNLIGIVFCICLGVNLFIPSKTEMYIIAGVSQLEAQGTTAELAETAKLINQYLQGEIKKKIEEK